MLKINNNTSIELSDVLFVFALESEAKEYFNHTNKLLCGVGKINAAIALTKALQNQKPKLIVNLGSAGGNGFSKGDVICCTKFIQRDMDAQGLGFKKFETPLSENQLYLNLAKLNVQELTKKEQRSTEGGWLGVAIVLIVILAAAYAANQDRDK